MEDDDESASEFLCNSYLDKTRVNEQIIKAIEEVISRLSFSNANKEWQKEELDGSAKGQKARASQIEEE